MQRRRNAPPRRSLDKARAELLAAGSRVKAVHVKNPDRSILVKPAAIRGKDFPEYYQIAKGVAAHPVESCVPISTDNPPIFVNVTPADAYYD